ncbi:hypothetical protein PFISCL1PPCAC_12224, partial [Pristionchus fissidentatus]
RTFKVSQNLDHHMRTKHGLQLYDCDFCEEKFRRQDEMIRHRAAHDENPIPELLAKVATRIERRGREPSNNRIMRCPFCANGFYHVS